THDVESLLGITMLYLVTVLTAFALQTGHTLVISHAAMRTIANIRNAIFKHTVSLAASFFDRTPKGQLLTRATSDVAALGETLTAGAITIVLDVILVIAIVIAMLAMDARLTLVLMFVAPPLALIINAIRKSLRRLYLGIRTSLATLNSYTAERLGGIEIVQLYSDEQRTLTEFDRRLAPYRDAAIKANVFDALLYAIVDGLSAVCIALMLWYGSGGFFESTISAGLLAAFIDYVGKLFRPIREFSQKVATIQRASSALEKIFGLLDVDEQIPQGDRALSKPEGHVVIEDLSFAYSPDDTDVLTNVDLHIAPGEVVAIVGRTGSGKTTIGKLLTRTYTGYRGQITLDGHSIDSLDLVDLQRAIGVVHQDVHMFPADVRFNLTLGREIADEVLEEALALARAGSVVKRLGGLDGHVEHGGHNVSVGEAQLLSIARALVHDAPTIILDEATASVDSLTETAIQAATEALFARKTVLVIAHRLSTIVRANRIVLLDGGVVEEVGSHEELMEMNGRYAHLFRQQFISDTVNTT
ncbi:MAG: ABC transporter ATP-binding protein, partial [Proteobacteria bacterium]|nr:ABC transporter ATP-binding protein [Pseudomonadota bacterium]